MKIGANYLGNGRCEFTVWAPAHDELAVQIVSPENRVLSMEQDSRGYFSTMAENIAGFSLLLPVWAVVPLWRPSVLIPVLLFPVVLPIEPSFRSS